MAVSIALQGLFDAVGLVTFGSSRRGGDMLRGLFGPSKEEIWRQLCAEIGAQYVEGGFFRQGKVIYEKI